MTREIGLRATDREGRESQLRGRVGASLMTALCAAGQDVAAVCGGVMACATCHVRVADDWIARTGARGADEDALLAFLDSFDPRRSRLACQIVLTPDLDGLEIALAPEQ
jgi:2Fe-2S ferredoxin